MRSSSQYFFYAFILLWLVQTYPLRIHRQYPIRKALYGIKKDKQSSSTQTTARGHSLTTTTDTTHRETTNSGRRSDSMESSPTTSSSSSSSLFDLHPIRVKVAAERYIIPGDYVATEEYGIGQYLGVRQVVINPSSVITTLLTQSKQQQSQQSQQSQQQLHLVPAAVIQFLDGQYLCYERFADKFLYYFRSGEGGYGYLPSDKIGSLLDNSKWKKKQKTAREKTKQVALNIVNIMAIRNTIHRTPCLPDSTLYQEFENRFAYTPTSDQLTSFAAIAEDMINATRPMDRLICGDVGFGKTEVAMRAIYRAVVNHKQVAVLVPTTVLANQHMRTLQTRMPDVTIRLLKGNTKDKTSIKEELVNGSCQVVVGTHAILQSDIKFHNLGLLVIDEEQRFGVVQKDKLKSSFQYIHIDILTLSATPIPRTLQLSLSGLRDFNLISSPPENRKPVQVSLHHMGDYSLIKDIIQKEIARDGQVFVVVPFVRDLADVKQMLTDLIPFLKMITIYGGKETLEQDIQAFIDKEADVLLATTVIENGIDMPNVNTLIVLNAERFGISTLYQLRGRVGRSDRQAYAHFFTMATHELDVSDNSNMEMLARKVIRTTTPTTPLLGKVHEVKHQQQQQQEEDGEESDENDDLINWIDSVEEDSSTSKKKKVKKGKKGGGGEEEEQEVDKVDLLTVARESVLTSSTDMDKRVNRFYQAAKYNSERGGQSLNIKAEQRLVYLQAFTALGSGYDLACRDMELRGSGTVFGSDQSGYTTNELGPDMQHKILKEALEELNQQLILAVPETRVEIGSPLEGLLRAFPSVDNLPRLSIYEAELIEKVTGGNEVLVRDLMTSKTAHDIAEVMRKHHISIPHHHHHHHHHHEGQQQQQEALLADLMIRVRLRIAGRRLGLIEIKRSSSSSSSSYDFDIFGKNVTPQKLEKILFYLDKKLKRTVTLEIDEDETQSGDCTVLKIGVSFHHHTEDDEVEEVVLATAAAAAGGGEGRRGHYDMAKADQLAELLEKMSEVVQHQLMKSDHMLLSDGSNKKKKKKKTEVEEEEEEEEEGEGGGGSNRGRGRRRKVV